MINSPFIVYPFFDMCCSKIEMDIHNFSKYFKEINDPKISKILMIAGNYSENYYQKIVSIIDVMRPKIIIKLGECTKDFEFTDKCKVIKIKGCPPTEDAIKEGYLQLKKLEF